MLIDSTYFDGPLLIAGFDKESVRLAVDKAITKYEPEYLRKVMGASLYAAFMAGTTVGNGAFSEGFSSGFGNAGTIADRWLWIRDGHTFTYGTDTFYYPGIKEAIACYVYWHYMNKNARQTTTMGVFMPKAENAKNVGPSKDMMDAWNTMVDINNSLSTMVYYLLDDDLINVYPEFAYYERDPDLFIKQTLI